MLNFTSDDCPWQGISFIAPEAVQPLEMSGEHTISPNDMGVVIRDDCEKGRKRAAFADGNAAAAAASIGHVNSPPSYHVPRPYSLRGCPYGRTCCLEPHMSTFGFEIDSSVLKCGV